MFYLSILERVAHQNQIGASEVGEVVDREGNSGGEVVEGKV